MEKHNQQGKAGTSTRQRQRSSAKTEEKLMQKEGEEGTRKESTRWTRLKDQVKGLVSYPPSVLCILGCEFCERFNFYGLRTILVLYLTEWLMFPPDSATSIFHIFVFICYFSPLFGAILADGYWGRYKTILYISVIYALGSITLALTAIPPPEIPGPLIGLLLIALGTGGIKPCVASFGGDQFASYQAKERVTFFSAFYFIINLGSMISTFLTPMLRADVKCYGKNCYPLAFGIPALLMFVSLVVFVCGEKHYRKIPPSGSNLFGQVIKCICVAVKRRWSSKEKKEHWLDHAAGAYEEEFIQDVKRLMTVLFLFVPLPIFWTLFDQQGSRWTLQAAQLNGDLGALGRLKPDQLQVLNPLLILAMIPIFEKFIYPALDCCRIPNRPLQRMVAGMLLCSVSFMLAAFVQIKIDAVVEAPISSKETGVTVLNTLGCPVNVHSRAFSVNIPSLKASELQRLETSLGKMEVGVSGACVKGKVAATLDLTGSGGQAFRLVASQDASGLTTLAQYSDLRNKSSLGDAAVSIFTTAGAEFAIQLLKVDPHSKDSAPHQVNVSAVPSPFLMLEPGSYSVLVPEAPGDTPGQDKWIHLLPTLTLGSGGVTSLALLHPQGRPSSGSKVELAAFTTLSENTQSMFLMFPQYVTITIGEVLFSPTGLAFAYTQAPQSMKSVVSACWLLTTAFGNLLTSIVTELRVVPSQMWEFVMFASLMFIFSIVFAFMTLFYKYKPASVTLIEDETALIEEETNKME